MKKLIHNYIQSGDWIYILILLFLVWEVIDLATKELAR